MSIAEFKKSFIRSIVALIWFFTSAEKDFWKKVKIRYFVNALFCIPVNIIRGKKRSRDFVENNYDRIAGTYIRMQYYESIKNHSLFKGSIQKISTLEFFPEFRSEINSIISGYAFKSILEVGGGELNALEAIYSAFGPGIDCYSIDLSFNRIYHGLSEFRKRHEKIPTAAKADAVSLPFPDNSFDLVYTVHTIEQIPDNYKTVLNELFRVSRGSVVLFEPSYALGCLTQKLQMIKQDYVRGIKKYLDKQADVELEDFFLMKNSVNPLNHAACYKIKVRDKKGINNSDNSLIDFVCPVCRSGFEKKNNYYYCGRCSKAYMILEDIPILDPVFSVYMTAPFDARGHL
jgi:ubiquinone/menaquinone biosynthesis C-methylase UbiE